MFLLQRIKSVLGLFLRSWLQDLGVERWESPGLVGCGDRHRGARLGLKERGLVYILMRPREAQASRKPPTVLITWGEDAQVPVRLVREASGSHALPAGSWSRRHLWPSTPFALLERPARLSSGSSAPNVPCSPALSPSTWRPVPSPQHPLCLAYPVCFMHLVFRGASGLSVSP